MPEDNKEVQKPDTDDATASTDTAQETQDTGKSELADLLADKRVQGEIDRRIASMQKKLEEKAVEREKRAAEKAKREAEEARLLEKEDLKGLLDLKAKEAAEATAKLEQYERDLKVQSLLDKKGVTDPALRAIWLKFNGDLQELDTAIDAFTAGVSSTVEKVVNERLKTTPPPQSETAKKEKAMSLTERIAAAEKAGNWAESLRLKNQILDEQHKQQRLSTAAPVPQ